MTFASAIADDTDLETSTTTTALVYEDVDTFDNRTHAGTAAEPFGVASSGGTWVSAIVGSFNGGVSGGIAYAEDDVSPPAHLPSGVAEGEFEVRVRFRTTDPIVSATSGGSWLYFGMSDTIEAGYGFGDDGPFVEVHFENNSGLGDRSLQLGLWGGDALFDPGWMGDYVYIPAAADVVTFVTNAWFLLQWHLVPGVLMEAKLWRDGDAEPAYQISDVLTYRYGNAPPSGHPLTGTYFWMSAEGGQNAQTGRCEIDYIRNMGGPVEEVVTVDEVDEDAYETYATAWPG